MRELLFARIHKIWGIFAFTILAPAIMRLFLGRTTLEIRLSIFFQFLSCNFSISSAWAFCFISFRILILKTKIFLIPQKIYKRGIWDTVSLLPLRDQTLLNLRRQTKSKKHSNNPRPSCKKPPEMIDSKYNSLK